MNMKDFIKAVQSQNKVVVLPVPILAWMYKQGIDSLEKYKKFFDYSINVFGYRFFHALRESG